MNRNAFSFRLFGAFQAWLPDGTEIAIPSKKLRALLALLALAPDGRRSRTFLRSMLWANAFDEERASNSLRQCLTSLRQTLGDHCDFVFDDRDKSCVHLRLENVVIVGSSEDGQFLEGLDLYGASEFESWLRLQRQSPPALHIEQASPKALLVDQSEHLMPAIAVLPFCSLGDVQEFKQLGDMFAEEVSRCLSRSHYANIKSHFSCRRIDARRIDLGEIKKLLKVDYVVSGVLRRDGNEFQIKADLIDVKSGDFVWSSDFSGGLADFFSGQSPVVVDVALSVSHSVFSHSCEMVSSKPLPDTESHALFMSAVTLLHKLQIGFSARSRMYLEELCERAPNNSIVHSWLSMWYVLCLSQGWHNDPATDGMRAKDCVSRALDINPDCAFSLAVDGVVESNILQNFDHADKSFDAALQRDPNNVFGLLFSGVAHAFRGDADQAVALTKRSRFLSPLDPGSYLFDTLSATAELSAHNYADALRLAERSYRRNPLHNSTLRVRTIALHELGRIEEARTSAAELAEREPDLTVEDYRRSHPSSGFETGERWASALENAGIRHS